MLKNYVNRRSGYERYLCTFKVFEGVKKKKTVRVPQFLEVMGMTGIITRYARKVDRV